jgi:hypothetical protein
MGRCVNTVTGEDYSSFHHKARDAYLSGAQAMHDEWVLMTGVTCPDGREQ